MSGAATELESEFAEHTSAVLCCRFSPTNPVEFASGSWDATVRVWNIAQRCAVAVLTGHTGWVNYLRYTRDGNSIVTCSNDCTWGVYTGFVDATPSSASPRAGVNRFTLQHL